MEIDRVVYIYQSNMSICIIAIFYFLCYHHSNKGNQVHCLNKKKSLATALTNASYDSETEPIIR